MLPTTNAKKLVRRQNKSEICLKILKDTYQLLTGKDRVALERQMVDTAQCWRGWVDKVLPGKAQWDMEQWDVQKLGTEAVDL